MRYTKALPFKTLAGDSSELTADGELYYDFAGRHVEKTVQVVLGETDPGTVTLEGTIDGEAWCTLGAAINETTLRYVPESVSRLRVVLADAVGGASVRAYFAGFDPRTGD